jgi:hypothetical protein
MNWLAILCAGAAYWVLGYIWYTLLFGKIYMAEQARHRGERPANAGGMGPKLIGTFICNIIAAAALAYLFKRTAIADLNHALRLAAATGIGFASTALTAVYIWDSKPTKVWMIDTGYNFVGALIMAIIFVSW